jgi:hypothetical protein
MDIDKLIHEENIDTDITPGGNHGYRCTVLYKEGIVDIVDIL